MVPLSSKRFPVRAGQQSLALLGGEPVPYADSDPAYPLYSPNSGSQFRTEETGVGCFISDATNCS
jgi:hypothetical protein